MENKLPLLYINRLREGLLALLNNSPFPDENSAYDLLSRGSLEIRETNKPSKKDSGRDGIVITVRVAPQIYREYADDIRDSETALENRVNDLIPESYGCEVQYAEIVPSIEDDNLVAQKANMVKESMNNPNLHPIMGERESLGVGDKIGNHTVTEVLSGGMSEVYRVINEKGDTSKRYVLKRAKAESTPDEIKLFKREVRILQSLHSPNIIEVLDADTDADLPYYVMPSCGKSFEKLANNIPELEKTRYAIASAKLSSMLMNREFITEILSRRMF